jgi:hypothetical protein
MNGHAVRGGRSRWKSGWGPRSGLSSTTPPSPPTPTGSEVFARANPESVEIEETFGFVQEISRNRSLRSGPDDPTGCITISLPYDGDKCFTRHAVRDVEQHLKRRVPSDGDVEALVGHLILANYQHTNLPDPDVLNLTGRHGVVPLRLPVRSSCLRKIQDLVSDRHEYHYEVAYTPARPKIIPIELKVDLEDPDHADLPEPHTSDDGDLDSVAKKIMEYVGFQPMLRLRLTVHLTLPARRGQAPQAPKVRRVSVKLPTITSLAPSSLQLEVDGEPKNVQHNPENVSLEWFDVPTTRARDAGEDEPWFFHSPSMVMTITQPGELFTRPTLVIEVEAETPGELLSGMDARLFDARGRRYRRDGRNPLTIHSTITTQCTLVLRDAFASRQLSPYQSFHFDEIIPDDLRIADIATALSDQRFEVRKRVNVTGRKNKAGLRHVLLAERTEGPDTMALLVLVQGHRHTTQRRLEQSQGRRYTTTFDSGDLGIIVYGWVHRDTRDLIHEINELQSALRDRFRRLKAPR